MIEYITQWFTLENYVPFALGVIVFIVIVAALSHNARIGRGGS